jgi:hypothetical protein
MTKAVVLAILISGTAHADKPSLDETSAAIAKLQTALGNTFSDKPHADDTKAAVALMRAPFKYEIVFVLDKTAACAKKPAMKGTVAAADLERFADCYSSTDHSGLTFEHWDIAAPDKLPKSLARYKAPLAALAKDHLVVSASANAGNDGDLWTFVAATKDAGGVRIDTVIFTMAPE